MLSLGLAPVHVEVARENGVNSRDMERSSTRVLRNNVKHTAKVEAVPFQHVLCKHL